MFKITLKKLKNGHLFLRFKGVIIYLKGGKYCAKPSGFSGTNC